MALNPVIDFIRQLKITYTTYNFLHQRKLKHNRAPYKKYGVRKFLFQNISSSFFKGKKTDEIPWIDRPNVIANFADKLSATDFSEKIKSELAQFPENGYAVLHNFFDDETVNNIQKEIEKGLASGRMKYTLGNKIMFANLQSDFIRKITWHDKLNRILSFLLGKKVIPFQTINFLTGSEQKAHSDSIHMTTYPLGFLIAAWIALEDIDESQGPIFYYPGSHKLPYVLNSDYERGGNIFTVGADSNYLKYEEKIEEIVKNSKLEKKLFTAKKGDVLIWHANLIHGGEKITDNAKTRKSMVIHFYAEDVVKYHEITERPALLD